MSERDETVLFFKDLYKTLMRMPNEDAGVLMKALFAHANGLDPDDLDKSPIADALYCIVSDQMDRLDEYRSMKAAAGKAGGIKSGETRSKSKQTEANAKQNEADEKQTEPPYPYPYPIPSPNPMPMTDRPGPTVQEVKDYADEEGLVIDAERFVAYYDAKDWKTGTDPIKDWKKVARKWAVTERKEKPPDRKKPGKYAAWLESKDYSELVNGRRA